MSGRFGLEGSKSTTMSQYVSNQGRYRAARAAKNRKSPSSLRLMNR